MGFWKYFKKLLPGKNEDKVVNMSDLDISEREKVLEQIEITSNLEENIDNIKQLFGDSFDLIERKISIGPDDHPGVVIYMEGLIDTRAVEDDILQPLNIDFHKITSLPRDGENTYKTVVNHLLNNKDINESEDLSEILKKLATGYTLILFEGTAKGILCETQDFQIREIQEPEGEVGIRGPRDGFVENIEVNTSLLRNRLRIPHLWIQNMEIGNLSKTNVAVTYIKGLASEKLVEEVKARLKKINIDNVLESGAIQEYLVDQPYTLLPLIMRTERPDKVVSCLVEGKVAIITSGTPFVLVVPTTFNALLQAPDDYYEIFPIGSFVRVMRHITFQFSLILPGVYVAIVNFHPELIPISLLLRIAASREGVPFPIAIEALIMEVLFEVLREAGLRLPKAIGSAISIVGALILGEAAISAGLVSPSMVIIVALTAISSFSTPDYSLALAARILRFGYLFLGATLGLFGIQFGLLVLLIHLCSLRSFGQPYFQPYGPLIWSDLKDSAIRFFWWGMKTRPKLIGYREPERQGENGKPETPDSSENTNSNDKTS